MIKSTRILRWLAITTSIPLILADTEANCTLRQFDWAFNSLGLSPCHVGNQLLSPCNNNSTYLVPLPAGNQYYLDDRNLPCWCNTVAYSLVSACSLCQGSIFSRWSLASQNCSSTWMSAYPEAFPQGIRVPRWAFFPISAGTDTFDMYAASAAGGADLTANPSSTPSSSTSPPPSITATGVPETSVSSNVPSRPPTLAIALGVVGGMVGLALVAALLFFYRRNAAGHSQEHRHPIMPRPMEGVYGPANTMDPPRYVKN